MSTKLLMCVDEQTKSRVEIVHVRLSECLGWPQASPRESQRCPISSLAIVEPRSAFVFEERHAVLRVSGHRCRVTGKTKIRHWRGERIALLWQSCHIRESLTPDASRSRDTPARLCWQTASSRRLPAAVAARGVHQREREVESVPLSVADPPVGRVHGALVFPIACGAGQL